MKKVSAFKQRDLTDCGAACLASILGYYGSTVPISKIRLEAGTDQRGTNLLGIIQAAEACGLQAKGARGKADSLPLVPLPAIAHVVLPSGLHHYIVLTKAGKKRICFMDPADGRFHSQSNDDFIKKWSGVLIMFSPKVNFNAEQHPASAFSRFLLLARPYRVQMFMAFLGAVVYTILGFSTAIFLQKLMDDVIQQDNSSLLHLLGIFMVLILFVQTIIGVIRNIIGFKTGQLIDARLITGYYRHLFKLPQMFFDTMRVGEIISRVNDAIKIRFFINDIVLGIMLHALIVLFSVVLLCFYYWKLAIIVLAIFPVYFFLHYLTVEINRKWQRRLMEQSADLEANLVESLQSASTVKCMGLEQYMVDKTESSFFCFMNSSYKTGLYNLYAGTTTEFLNRLLTISVLWAGGWYVMQRELTPGELLSFYSLIGYFTGPASALIISGKSVQDALIAADRLFEIIDLDCENRNTGPVIQLMPENLGDITFSSVSFRYGTRKNVFENLSLCFKKGEMTAIAGESGCGKSTILSLLQHLYPVKEGQITIGKIPLQHFSRESLRAKIGVVPQQVDLFSGTIAENIAIGDPCPDMERIIEVCKAVGAETFIEQLTDGYFCRLGENGASLSGGQRQKLAIARALYRRPEVFVMDEATAHLDPFSEQKIQELIGQLKAAGKTVIIIAHRLSTIRWCDTIHVLKNGKLLNSGTHEYLMEYSVYYASLWKSPQEKLYA
ncbi:peptidase domain-containing ABC transporter [Flavihumibacter profundi]|uniref:peptidase domain-containing ABC transporter n=1 Tax=Flavihumibacter profundi TaxID=2716883 RepID=UPI001CC34162|nr:peptidase domain-containing ABC transporter [Flavihumibacter profundi]MBZ5859234.1 peptidase domain-containing ABC transporter [Flavihumibacter profundi]